MKFVQLVLRRPMSVIMLILGIVVFGSASLSQMPLEYMPDMEMPMELVMVTWPGADADSVDRSPSPWRRSASPCPAWTASTPTPRKTTPCCS